MEILIDQNTYLSIKHKDGTVPNEFYFLFAKSGYGKTLHMESLIEEYHRAGYTILILSDVKDEWELGYAMFEPIKPYHVNKLRLHGKPIQTKDVKLYHPYSNNIPTNLLPEITFYGFSLKKLKRPEWSMLTESAWESETIRLLLNASNSIKDSDGLYNFLHFIQDNIIGKKEGSGLKPDPRMFHLRTTGGTAKSLQDVASYFFPFKKHSFLVSEKSELNIDWRELLNDNKHYHVFGTRWIDDEKLKEFTILALLNQIIRNRRFTTKPTLIVIPEIRFLTPIRPKGYKEFLAKGMTGNISTMRNIGRGGNSGLFDSQVWMDVDESVRNSGTQTFYGEMGGSKDIENITKAMRYKSEVSQQLKSPDYPRSVMKQDRPDYGNWTIWLPGHMHSEEEYDFFDMYKKHFKEKMKPYKELIERITKENKEEENKIREKVKKQIKAEKEEIERKKKEKEERGQEKIKDVDVKIKKYEEEKELDLEKRKQLAFEIYSDETLDKKDKTYRAIARRLGITHVTAKKYIDNEKKKEGNNSSSFYQKRTIPEEVRSSSGFNDYEKKKEGNKTNTEKQEM